MATKTNQLGRVFEKIYSVVGMLFVIGTFSPLFRSSFAASGAELMRQRFSEGNFKIQIVSGLLYLSALVLLMPNHRATLKLIKENWILLSFIAYIVVSAFWAEFPVATFRRSVALFGTTLFAVFLAVRFQPEELLHLFAMAFIVAVFTSIIMVFLFPHLGGLSSTHPGAWSGGIGHKNDFGRIMLLGVVVLWITLPRSGQWRPLWWAALILGAICTIMSQSRTAWIVFACLVIALPLLMRLRESNIPFLPRLIVMVAAGLAIVVTITVVYVDDILLFLGREATLTGRTGIWERAIAIGLDRPWLGHGYRSFWNFSVSFDVVGHGHNSFLDLWLELGFVGAGLFLVLFNIFVGRALGRLQSSNDRQ
jgi:O-antigen ligase